MERKETIKFLNQYHHSLKEIERLSEERQRVRAVAEKAGCSIVEFRAGTKAVTDTMADFMCKLDKLEGEIFKAMEAAIQKRNEVASAIEQVSDVTLQRLLKYRYINGYKFGTIADIMAYDERQIRRKHNVALDIVAEKIEVK